MHLIFSPTNLAYPRPCRAHAFLQIRDSSNLLAKGTPPLPGQPPPDVIDWTYSGNRLHPTQKPVPCLKPLIAAQALRRRFIGIDPDHHRTARARLATEAVT